MIRYLWMIGAMLFSAPSTAYAECRPTFTATISQVDIQVSSLDDQRVSERFFVEVRNAGGDACQVRLGVGRDVGASARSFPSYVLSGPTGLVPAAVIPSVSKGSEARTTSVIHVPANGQVSIPYDVRIDVNWGMSSGAYDQELYFELYDAEGQQAIASQRTRLRLNIPPGVRIRFAGASGADGAAQLAMGDLSTTSKTQSPPFAIRVQSTSAYRIELSSQNRGSLLRTNGPDLIPYEMRLDGELLNLQGAGDYVTVNGASDGTGKVHPVRVVIEPDPTRHAGTYSDRVTVTITTI